jgi:hypothetical protein
MVVNVRRGKRAGEIENEKIARDHPTGGIHSQTNFDAVHQSPKHTEKEAKKKKEKIMDVFSRDCFIERTEATWAPGEVMKRHR